METPEDKEKPFVWTPELVKEVFKDVNNLADRWITYKQNEAEADNKYMLVATKHNRHVLFTLVLFLGAVIAFMSYLTLTGRVSGDALLFLVGTVTGYVIVFIQRLIFGTGSNSEASQEEQL